MRRLPNTPLTDSQRRLIAENLGLVHTAAMKYSGNLDVEDVVGEASLRLCRSIHNFDPARGLISTFVFLIVRTAANEIRQYQHRGGRSLCNASLDKHAYLVPGKRDAGPSLDRARAFRCLPPRHAAILALRYSSGGSRKLSEVANLIGVTKQRVHQLQAAAIDNVRIVE